MHDTKGRFYEMSAITRDETIIALRRRGVSLKRIGKVVGMSESGVSRALQRIKSGGIGQGATRA